MARNLKEALERNRRAAEDLDRALRDCLAALKDVPGEAADGRFQVIEGGRNRRIRRADGGSSAG